MPFYVVSSMSDDKKEAFECEEVMLKEYEKFGNIRTDLIESLKSKYGPEIVNKTLGRINKRKLQGSFDGTTLTDLYRHSTKLIK